MRVAPGQPIPFWLRLWNGRTDRFVVAHLTSTAGVEQPGSPYLLPHVQRGIYAAAGPLIGTSDLNVDYEVYRDAGLTLLDRAYLPSSEYIEADVSNSEVLSQILGKLSSVSPDTIQGFIESNVLRGIVESNMVEASVVEIAGTLGTVENNTQDGALDSTTIEGDSN